MTIRFTIFLVLFVSLSFLFQLLAQGNLKSTLTSGSIKDITTIYKIPFNSSPTDVVEYMLQKGIQNPITDIPDRVKYKRVRIGRIPVQEVIYIFAEEKLKSVNIIWTRTKFYERGLAYFKAVYKILLRKYGKVYTHKDKQVLFNENLVDEYIRIWRFNKNNVDRDYFISLTIRSSDVRKDKDFVKTPEWEFEDDETYLSKLENEKRELLAEPKVRVELLYSFYSKVNVNTDDF